MSEQGWISIVDWKQEYEHYDPEKRSSNPRGGMSWIKNYTRLMNNDEYLELTEHCALILHRLWLVYASSACRLRADTRSLSRKLDLRVTKSHLDSLNHAGFITIVASKSLAEGYLAASSARGSVEVEVEVEENPPTHLDVEDDVGGRGGIESDYDLPTLDERPNLEPDNGASPLEPTDELKRLIAKYEGDEPA